MPLASFSDLVAGLADEFGRSDLSSARVETLCIQVEADLNNRPGFRTLDMLTTSTVPTVEGMATVALPAGARYIEGITLDDDPNWLAFATSDRMDTIWPVAQRGRPVNYCPVAGGLVRLAPIPDGVYTVNFVTGGAIPNLSSAAPTNWLMTNAPLVYFYGCAFFNALKIKDRAQQSIYADLYEKMVDGLIGADDRLRYPPNLPLIPTVIVRDGIYGAY